MESGGFVEQLFLFTQRESCSLRENFACVGIVSVTLSATLNSNLSLSKAKYQPSNYCGGAHCLQVLLKTL